MTSFWGRRQPVLERPVVVVPDVPCDVFFDADAVVEAAFTTAALRRQASVGLTAGRLRAAHFEMTELDALLTAAADHHAARQEHLREKAAAAAPNPAIVTRTVITLDPAVPRHVVRAAP